LVPNAIASIVLLCLLFSSILSLAALASLTAFAIPAAPPPRAPKAERPANKGISGNNPPVFGIGIILFLGGNILPHLFRDANASFAPPLTLLIFFPCNLFFANEMPELVISLFLYVLLFFFFFFSSPFLILF